MQRKILDLITQNVFRFILKFMMSGYFFQIIDLIKRQDKIMVWNSVYFTYFAFNSNWSALAKDVLGECFSSDKRNTEELLVRKLSNWGDVTCMVIATNAYNQDFISLPACQSLIDHAWDGKQR